MNVIQKFDLLRCSNLKELHLFIGQLNALQELYLYECPNLRELLSSIGPLNALQIFIYKIFLIENIVKEIHLSMGILNALKVLHLLGCSNFKKLFSSINHWVHLKILICVNVSTCKNYLHVHWPIKCTPSFNCGNVWIVGIAYVYWPI